MSAARRTGTVAAAAAAGALAAALAFGLAGHGGAALPRYGGGAPAVPQGPAPAAAPSPSPPAPPSSPPACYLGVLLPGESVEVTAEVAGRVRRVAVRPGDRVAAGALLAAVAADDLRHALEVERAGVAEAESLLAELEVEVRRAAREHERRVALGELLSQAQVDAAAFELEAASRRRDGARAELARARAQLARGTDEAGRSTVRAPFAGRVALRHVDAGAVVAAGTPLVRLIGDGEPLVRFAVPPDEAAGLEPGTPLRVELEAPASRRRATLRRVAPEIDAASQTVFAEATLDGAGNAEDTLPAGGIVRVTPAAAAEAPSCFEGGAAR